MPTPLEIVDTVVKIGLGSIIAGLGGYLVARHESRSQTNRERSNRRATLLEGVATDVEDFAHIALRVWAFTTELVRQRERGEAPNDVTLLNRKASSG